MKIFVYEYIYSSVCMICIEYSHEGFLYKFLYTAEDLAMYLQILTTIVYYALKWFVLKPKQTDNMNTIHWTDEENLRHLTKLTKRQRVEKTLGQKYGKCCTNECVCVYVWLGMQLPLFAFLGILLSFAWWQRKLFLVCTLPYKIKPTDLFRHFSFYIYNLLYLYLLINSLYKQ